MTPVDRREFLRLFGALGGCFVARASLPFVPDGQRAALPRPYAFPQGVASGDPTPEGVVLWSRVESADGRRGPITLRAQVSRSRSFETVLVDRSLTVTEESDHTLRLLVDGLAPARRYFYRFVAPDGSSSPTGRTFTAPAPDDPSSVRLAMESCQHHQLGYMTPYRRLIHEDEARSPEDRIRFVLHLGDFIYEEIWYPEEQETFLRRRVRDTIRLPHGARTGTLRYPVTLADYRHLYRAYLSDPDLRAARARWPFICTWDDHEFSNNSWQSQQMYDGAGRPAQSRKVAANQAWFEYIPPYLTGSAGVDGVSQGARDFTPVRVSDAPIEGFDDAYRSLEPNNRAAIESLVIYRSLRWGRNVELVVTDNRSFRSPPVPPAEVSERVASRLFWIHPQRVMEILDAGRTWNDGAPPETFEYGGEEIANPNRERPPGTALGAEQKRWWKETLRRSDATWKVWANSFGTLTRRADFQNLPENLRDAWRGDGYGVYGNDDWEAYPAERAELLGFVREHAIGNFVSLSGDRHNFTAGHVAGSLDPGAYEPVGVEFGVSSLTTPTSFEAFEYLLERRPELEPLYIRRGEGGHVPVINLLFQHGVAAALEYAATGDLDAALARSNPDVAPHLHFLDMGSHGYATVVVCTVHAPHWPMPHPNLVPVRPSSSRSTHRRGTPSGTSTLSRSPFTVSSIRAMGVLSRFVSPTDRRSAPNPGASRARRDRLTEAPVRPPRPGTAPSPSMKRFFQMQGRGSVRNPDVWREMASAWHLGQVEGVTGAGRLEPRRLRDERHHLGTSLLEGGELGSERVPTEGAARTWWTWTPEDLFFRSLARYTDDAGR